MTPQTDQYAAFRHTSYQRYFTSRFLTGFSTHILTTTIAFHLYDVTGSALWLGMIGVVLFLPSLFLVVVTGMAADRLDRRKVMAGATVMLAISAAIVAVLSAIGKFEPLWVMAAMALVGIGRAFHSPASSSLVVNLVPKEDFGNAIGWITSSWQLASIVGPAVAGISFAIIGGWTYLVSTLFFLIAALSILSIPKPAQLISKEAVTIRTLLGGFEYVWKTKIVLGAITLDLFAVFLGSAFWLMPLFAKDILEIGAVGNGFLRAAPGIGAILMAVYLIRFPVRDHAGKILLVSVFLFGVATIVFGYSELAWLSIIALMFVGAFDMISVYIREILLQVWTPDHVRGRVNAVNSIFLGASNELGDARAGFVAAKWGAVLTVILGGFAAIGVVGIVSVIFPDLRKVRTLDQD
ncbi:MAG: MFS transporter [Hellea sp.]|nr:MFS transporter [Hellea sp.]